MNRHWIFSCVTAVAAWMSATSPAFSQMGGNQQTGGTSGTGTGLGGNTAGSASSLSQSQGFGLDRRFTGSGFNQYMTGSATMGQTTAGARAGTAGAFGQSATQTQTQNSSRFGGVGNIGGLGGLGGIGGMRGMGAMGGMMMGGYGRNMMGGMGGMGMQQQNSQRKSVRTHLRLGFPQPTLATGTVSAQFTRVVNRVLEREDVGGGQVTVSMEGNTAVLTGTVTSDHARSVLASLAMLEPGIGAVRNELTVNPDVPTPENAPRSRDSGRR
ncbi:MAG: BON domain-containing protein [Pirellulaceae bacterium]